MSDLDAPLHFAQQYWIGSLVGGNELRAKLCSAHAIRGRLDVRRLISAIHSTVVEVDAARIRLVRDSDGSILQRAHPPEQVPDGLVRLIQPSGVQDEDDFKAFVDAWVATKLAEPSDPFLDTPVTLGVIRLSTEFHALVVVLSQLFFDGRGADLLVDRILHHYASPGADDRESPGLEPSYLAAVMSTTSRLKARSGSDLDYWSRLLLRDGVRATRPLDLRGTDTSVLRVDASPETFRFVNDAAEAAGVTDCQWLIWNVTEFLGDELGLRDAVIQVTNDFRDGTDNLVPGLFSMAVPYVIDAEPASPTDVRSSLFKTMYHAQTDQVALAGLLQELSSRTDTRVNGGVVVGFRHFDPAHPATDLPGLVVERDVYGPPDSSMAEGTLSVTIYTFADAYRAEIFFNRGFVAEKVVDDLARSIFQPARVVG